MGLSSSIVESYKHLFSEAIEWYGKQLDDLKIDTSLNEDIEWFLNKPNYSLQSRFINKIKDACSNSAIIKEKKCVEYLRLICRDYKERLKEIVEEDDYSGTRFLWIDFDSIKKKIEDFKKMEKELKWSEEDISLTDDIDFLRR